jgi:serine/threonine-protein kinase HipA
MIDIKFCPSCLDKGFSTYSPKAAKVLFGGRRVSPLLDFEFDGVRNNQLIMEAMHRISVSGVQEKFPAVVEKGRIRIAGEDEQSTYILKPAPWDETLRERRQIPANEHLTMQIASQVYGIKTAANGLCFTPKGRMVYITKRFDLLPDGKKMLMEDFAAVIGRNEQEDGKEFKYRGCYEDIAIAIRKNIPAWMVDMERFFELIVFNYIYANGDDHLKNFSLILQGQDYRLAPAYDLLNTSLHVQGDDFGLDNGLSPHIERSEVFFQTGHPCRCDFERFGQHIGLVASRVGRILDKYMQLPESAITLVDRSFLNDKIKRYYLRIIKERITRFIRVSD